jgi:hypothetical protein
MHQARWGALTPNTPTYVCGVVDSGSIYWMSLYAGKLAARRVDEKAYGLGGTGEEE